MASYFPVNSATIIRMIIAAFDRKKNKTNLKKLHPNQNPTKSELSSSNSLYYAI